MNKLLIVSRYAKEYEEEFKTRSLPALKVMSLDRTYSPNKYIEEANIILGEPSKIAKILSQANQLKWVQSIFAGVELLCKTEQRTDYTLTGVKEVFGPLMSEYVFTYILGLEKNIFQTRENQYNSIWKNLPSKSLAGIKIGILGLGSIGKHIAKTASHFNMNVTGLKRSPGDVEYVKNVFKPSEINKFISDLDYLVITLPCTSATKNIIDKSVLNHMKKSAVLINVGRGSTIVEEDLIASLQNKMLRAAVLDVFETEPLPKNNPLWKMKNVIVTPHNSALSIPKDIVNVFEENYLNLINNKPLKYIVDFTKGY